MTFALDPPLTDELVGELSEVWLDVTKAGGAVGGAPTATRADLQPVIDDALGRIRSGRDHMVLARIGDRVVGFAFLTFRPGPLFRHWATVKRLQVHPALQGRGLGGRLLDEVARVARELGLEQLHLTVRGGTGTEGFYERHGYRIMARFPEVIRLAPDDTRDEIYMIARL
ncbi:MAG: GNAT family N-acetyltransferase [Actinomycetota bacterium]|nr:GNAT family N-acetyltransferase [Actinomycetota bacterium]